MRIRLDRKFVTNIAFIVGAASWIVVVIGNHGLGRISAYTPPVIAGGVGFGFCWTVGMATQVVTYLRHRPAMKKLDARRRRREDIERSKLKSFRLYRG